VAHQINGNMRAGGPGRETLDLRLGDGGFDDGAALIESRGSETNRPFRLRGGVERRDLGWIVSRR
jgi:hypothetical protein